MNPRLKTSKKWTALPKEYLTQVEEAFRESFPTQLKSAQVVVEGRIYTEEILLRVGILEKGRLRQANFEVSMSFSPKKKDAVDRIHDSIDAAASMMSEYFELKEGEEPDFPLIWKEYEFNGLPLFLQFSTVNSSLEAQADALLGEDAQALVIDEDEDLSEDVMDKAEVLIAPQAATIPDPDEENEGPSMFGGAKKKKKKKKTLQ
jgi:hypothetical protein